MNKRVSSRGVIISGDSVYTMFRRRIKNDETINEYYVIPGGGINEGETLEENVIREIKEEFNVDIKVLGYLGVNETENSIAHFFRCEIINGTPILGGEELEKNSNENYYEIRLVPLKDLDKINMIAADMIEKACKEEYI